MPASPQDTTAHKSFYLAFSAEGTFFARMRFQPGKWKQGKYSAGGSRASKGDPSWLGWYPPWALGGHRGAGEYPE